LHRSGQHARPARQLPYWDDWEDLPAAATADGPAGNERLTALAGAVLLVGFAAEGITILSLQRLLYWHFFIGLLLIGPVMLKIGSTVYRFTRYYTGHPGYVRKGPPAPLLRVLGPLVMGSSVAVLGTGVLLGLLGRRSSLASPVLTLHKLSFVGWFAVMSIHVLAYVWRLPRLIGADLPGAGYRRAAAVLRGRGWRWALLAGCVVAGLLIALAGSRQAASWQHGTGVTKPVAGPPASPRSQTGQPLALRITPAPYLLPSAIERETVFSQHGSLLIAGGLTAQTTTTAALTRLDPVTGQTTPVGQLAVAAHDAAGAMLAGQPYVFGGGAQTSSPDVQEAGAPGHVTGQLPQARSDLSAVTLGRVVYLAGGYDGVTYNPEVLATTDGRHFRVAARLPVPVRYAAMAGAGNQLWLFGGQTPGGPTNVIQQVDLATGHATIAGHLPVRLAGATGFSLDGQIFFAGGQTTRSGTQGISGAVYGYTPGQRGARLAGTLPVPVAYAAVAVQGGTAYLIGGDNGVHPLPSVTELRLVPASATATAASLGPGGAPWLGPPLTSGHLAPGSDPSVLPGDVLIADDSNNRLLIVDPQGRVRWEFPRPGDLAPGQAFRFPDDAFFSPDGKDIVATEEEYSVISVISIAEHKIIYRYGTPGVPGSSANHVSNPDDAMMMPDGQIISADIKNCRLLLLPSPASGQHRPLRIIGTTDVCGHNPPHLFGSPNGAFPATNGDYIVTEINGDWADRISLSGKVRWSVHPPGVNYPSDTNEVYPGAYLTADYSSPGQVVEFNTRGQLLWRFGGLNHPSLALPLPNGDILVNDDYNDRVIVIDPTTNRIVWQYGHTGHASTAPGYLNDPDGVDLTPPDSLLITHSTTMGQP
jgi:hypothetical protein